MNCFSFCNTAIDGLYIVKPIHHFSYDSSIITYNNEFDMYVQHIDGTKCSYIQDNESMSEIGVIRGMHTQLTKPQGKLIRVLHGSIYDAVIDVRSGSPTYGKYFGVLLSKNNGYQLLVPEGFLRGFLSLERNTIVTYKCTNYYDPADEVAVAWNDSYINIPWPLTLLQNAPVITKKEEQMSFETFSHRFRKEQNNSTEKGM